MGHYLSESDYDSWEEIKKKSELEEKAAEEKAIKTLILYMPIEEKITRDYWFAIAGHYGINSWNARRAYDRLESDGIIAGSIFDREPPRRRKSIRYDFVDENIFEEILLKVRKLHSNAEIFTFKVTSSKWMCGILYTP